MTEREEADHTTGAVATWLLQRGLPLGLAVLILAQLASWVPQYLTWPYYADHDVFASAARDWDAGRLPYRDSFCNNLPGTIYVFYLLGKAFGWGKTASFFAFDAALVAGFMALIVVWGHRCLRAWLPGLIGACVFLAYYLDLTYALTAQRDWHACALALGGLMTLQAWPGRSGRYASAVMMGTALLFRPQAIVFLPAYLLGTTAVAGWGLAFAATVLAGLSPLIFQGLLDDMIANVRLAAPGSTYYRTSLTSFVSELVKQLNPLRMVIVPLLVGLLGWKDEARRRVVRPWLLATVGALVYKPMSPFPHVYLDHVLNVTLAIDTALLAWIALGLDLSRGTRLALVLLTLAPTAVIKPRFCNPGGSLHSLATLGHGGEPEAEPNGYRPTPGLPAAAYYRWSDYRSTLQWVRENTRPTTRVANMLREVPALTGPTGRLSVFPAESVAWLKMVRREDEARFAAELEKTQDAVVVWIPDEVGLSKGFQTPLLDAIARRRFRLAERFGAIEVWVLADADPS